MIAIAGCEFHPNYVGAGVDASPADASTLTADARDASRPDAGIACPPGWFTTSGSTSHYQVFNSDATWHASERACEALQLAGGAMPHLLVIDNLDEALALVGAPGVGLFDYWTGMVQPIGQSAKDGGWRWITGGAASSPPWRAGAPDDGTILPFEDDTEQFAAVDHVFGLDDRPGDQALRRICECDGVGLDSALAVPP